MKVLFGAQGKVLSLFRHLDIRLRENKTINSSAYWISDSEYYYAVQSELFSSLNDSKPGVQKFFEWSYTSKPACSEISDLEISQLREKYKGFNLNEAVIADRRLYMGGACKVRQSYKSRYSDSDLSSIIYSALYDIDKYITTEKPDVVITFVPATFGDYLLAVAAKVNDVKYLQLRSTKIRNFVTFADSLSSVSTVINNSFLQALSESESKNYDPHVLEATKEYIDSARLSPLDYEGTIKVSKARYTTFKDLFAIARSGAGAFKKAFFPINAVVARDRHVPPPVQTWIYGSLFKGYFRWKADKLMESKLFDFESGEKYIFFPLHSEPEIALSVYGRNHQNQVETIRRLSQSLPLGWKLVIKEHPRTRAYRSVSWYESVISIPNVYFAPISRKPYFCIKEAEAVAVISGFVGFEAVVLEKPVLILGDTALKILPDSMVATVNDMECFYSSLVRLLDSYCFDMEALVAFVYAFLANSVAVNLYSDLLAKPGRNSMEAEERTLQMNRLSEHLESLLVASAYRDKGSELKVQDACLGTV